MLQTPRGPQRPQWEERDDGTGRERNGVGFLVLESQEGPEKKGKGREGWMDGHDRLKYIVKLIRYSDEMKLHYGRKGICPTPVGFDV